MYLRIAVLMGASISAYAATVGSTDRFLPRGQKVHEEQVSFGTGAQLVIDAVEFWPKLAGLRGTLEWSVSFPAADRYENRTLGAVAFWSPDAGAISR